MPNFSKPFDGSRFMEEDLFLARGEEISRARPMLTGDVYEGISLEGMSEPSIVVVLQHPCSMRIKGIDLRPMMLVAKLEPSEGWHNPQKWNGNFAKMGLPSLVVEDSDSSQWEIDFNQLHVVSSSSLQNRIACLSMKGICLLMQRWVHYSSRVLVEDFRFQDTVEGFLNETDLVETWCEELGAETPEDIQSCLADCTEWLREKEDGISRQDKLKKREYAPSIRRALMKHLKSLR